MKQLDDNDCTNCEGTGAERSGVEYYGQHEMVGCDWCSGTGFEDIYLGVDRLRTEISELRAKENELRVHCNKWPFASQRALISILNLTPKGDQE
jgi:hypothetical protein